MSSIWNQYILLCDFYDWCELSCSLYAALHPVLLQGALWKFWGVSFLPFEICKVWIITLQTTQPATKNLELQQCLWHGSHLLPTCLCYLFLCILSKGFSTIKRSTVNCKGWNKAAMEYFRHCISICLKRLKKTIKNLLQ